MSGSGAHHRTFLAFLSFLVRYIVVTSAMQVLVSSCFIIRRKEKFPIFVPREARAVTHARACTVEVTIPVTIVDRYVRDRVTIQDGKRSPLGDVHSGQCFQFAGQTYSSTPAGIALICLIYYFLYRIVIREFILLLKKKEQTERVFQVNKLLFNYFIN